MLFEINFTDWFPNKCAEAPFFFIFLLNEVSNTYLYPHSLDYE